MNQDNYFNSAFQYERYYRGLCWTSQTKWQLITDLYKDLMGVDPDDLDTLKAMCEDEAVDLKSLNLKVKSILIKDGKSIALTTPTTSQSPTKRQKKKHRKKKQSNSTNDLSLGLSNLIASKKE